MYKSKIRFSGLSSEVFNYTTHLSSVYYNESTRILYKDMSSLARLIRRNLAKYNLPSETRVTFRIYNEFGEPIGDRFYF